MDQREEIRQRMAKLLDELPAEQRAAILAKLPIDIRNDLRIRSLRQRHGSSFQQKYGGNMTHRTILFEDSGSVADLREHANKLRQKAKAQRQNSGLRTRDKVFLWTLGFFAFIIIMIVVLANA